MIGADIVAAVLKAHGVTFVSALCGNGIDPVLFAARQAGLRIIDTHNEQTASYMAECYARLTGRIGVCAVSSSVGFTNAMIGAVNARFDGAPMLLLSGASDHTFGDRGNFQDYDQVAAAAPIFKYTRLVDRADKVAFYVREAIAVAVSGRPGPVHLTIPMDVLAAEAGAPPLPFSPDAGLVHHACMGDAAAVEAAARAIAAARRPLLVAGSGCFYAHAAAALASFVTQTDIPVVVSIWERGCVETPLPQFMGVIGAASGSPRLLDSADLVILAGARVDYRVGYLQPPALNPAARVIRISADPNELRQGRDADVAIQGDPRSVLQQIAALLPKQPAAVHSAWLSEAQQRDVAFRSRWRTPLPDRPATGRHLIEALRPYIQGDAVFVVDGGNIGQWVHMALCDRYPGNWLTCGASGVIGFGLGGAMAARLAYPDRPVILLSGDGSMGFNSADMETAVRHKLPFVTIVADDQCWGIVVSGQKQRYGAQNMVACQLGPLRFDLIAEACGATGQLIDDPHQLGTAIQQALADTWPSLIQATIAQGGPAD